MAPRLQTTNVPGLRSTPTDELQLPLQYHMPGLLLFGAGIAQSRVSKRGFSSKYTRGGCWTWESPPSVGEYQN